jgi:hypothetical protein
MNPKVFEIFKEKYKLFPSILKIEMNNAPLNLIERFIAKSNLLFVNKSVVYDKIVEDEKLVEYDSTGILIYINQGKNIFILSTVDRLNVAEYTLHNLIKLNK